MRISAKGFLIALLFALLPAVNAFQGPPPVGIFDGIEFPDSPYDFGYMSERVTTFTVKKGTGSLTASGVYSLNFTVDNHILPVKGKAVVKDLSPLLWDFQIAYTNVADVRAGDYTFKMTAPLGGVFSNVLFATTNVPPVVTGTQAGTFYMAEKRVDMSRDNNFDILWQRDDGHLGVWFMGVKGNTTTLDTNLNKGIYFDSLYLATAHQEYDPNWRMMAQADLDLNGMQDWIWQNTNSGKMRVWLLANTNFVDPSLTNFNYHSYSKPVVSSVVDPNDFVVTTNLTPTSITNYFTRTTETISTNILAGPSIEVTTLFGTNVLTTNSVINLYTTNTTITTVANVTAVTNGSSVVYLTNLITIYTDVVTTNSFLDYTLTNVTVSQVSGRSVYVTNILNIPDLLNFAGESRVVANVGNSGTDMTNIFVYTNYPYTEVYHTNISVTTYADIVPGYFLVTYTTNYNITTTTVFENPFIREVILDEQSPHDANTRFIGCADFDNDGFPDYLFRNPNGSIFFESYFETFDEAVSKENRYLSGEGNLGWCVAGIIDLNNDGWPDLLWQNMKTGATAIWFMQGVSDPDLGYLYKHTKNGSLNGGAAMPTWKIAGNADFNHDGQMDVLLRNTKTGQLIFWYLNGSRTIKSSTISGPVLPWQIVGPK